MRLEDIVKSSLIKNLRQAINPETLTTELPLILKFLYNSTRYLKNPQDEKLLSNLIKKVKEDSVIVKLRLSSGENLLVWTTTPWTLPSNVAVAVNPNIDYVFVEEREIFILFSAFYFPKPLSIFF